MKKSKIIKLLLSSLLLASILLTACACTAVKQNEYAEQTTKNILDGIIAKDYETTRSIFGDIASDEAFGEFFATMSSMLEGTRSYELKQIGWHTRIDNGISSYSVTFEMETDSAERYIIEIHFFKDDNSLYHFNVVPAYSVDPKIMIPTQIGLAIVSIAACAFCIFMIIDCAKRKINKKALWIILILIGVSFTCIFGNELGFNFMTSFIFPISTIKTDGLSVAIKLTVPVGAIVYCCLRKKLTLQDREAETTDSAEITSEAEMPSEHTPTNTENQ